MNGEVVLSFNSRNNNTIISTAAHEQGSELPNMAGGEHFIMIHLELEAIQQPAAAIDSNINSSDDNLRRTMKAAVPIALFEAATSAGLIINPVIPLRFYFLVGPYNTLLILSLFIGLGIPMYSIMNHSSSSRISDVELNVWVVRMLMWLGSLSIFVALVLRGLMSQTNYSSSLLLAWILLFFIIIVGLIFLYLWMVSKKKKNRNNNIQTVPTSEGTFAAAAAA